MTAVNQTISKVVNGKRVITKNLNSLLRQETLKN